MLFVSLHIDFRIGNAITLVLTKIFIYFTNKFLVFRSKTGTKPDLAKEVLLFALARSFTGVVDFAGLILLVELLDIRPSIGKLLCIVVVTALNYFLSRKFVFKKGAQDD